MRIQKSLFISYWLAFFFGVFGAHLFYIGKNKRAIIYLLLCWTYIPIFLGWIDMFFLKKWVAKVNRKGGFVSLNQDFVPPVPEPEKKNAGSIITKNKAAPNQNLIYDEQAIILLKYARLKTPKSIFDEIESIKNPKNLSSNRNGGIITFTVSTSYSDFIKDSLKYRNQTGKPSENVPFMQYWTVFSSLGQKEMNWYFYWREQVLHGNYLPVDFSYIMLFTYELLNYSFNINAAFNVSMLVKLREAYITQHPKVDNYIPSWTADMLWELGAYDLSNELYKAEYVGRHSLYDNIVKHRHELHKISVTQWKVFITNYSETEFFKRQKSKIYTVFKGSIPLLDQALIEQGKELLDEWYNVIMKNTKRYMFNSAVMGRTVPGDVYMPSTVYEEKKLMFIHITNLFRLAENVTRLLLGEKRQIKYDESALPEGMKERMLDTFSSGFTNASNTSSRFVKVQGASTVQKGSSIPKRPETEVTVPVQPTPAFILDLDAIAEAKKANEEFSKLYKEQYGDEETSEEVSVVVKSPIAVQIPDERPALIMEGIFGETIANMDSFVNELDPSELELLAIFNESFKPATEISRFAKTLGMSANVIITSINEKAIEHLGDNLIEQDGDTYVIVDEYIALLTTFREEQKV